MKIGRNLNLKEYLWTSLNKLTNSFTNLAVINLGNGYIKCIWEISSIDNFRIDFSKSRFFAIRLFDITNSRNINNSTCIMKEIQVNKFQSSITFPIPINKGVYYFEFGYRKKNGEWRHLACQDLKLGYRIKKVIHYFNNDDWFDSKICIREDDLSFHEKAYQLSLNSIIGGSENISYEKEMTD
ncbi:DUF4912 domain-containing protein [Prochlorococcus marinus]|uniref:DUF4912 domain-containing protein n=1 Tax=Prochlorococcus marinus TaxID=1219 RepID=UPI0022B4202F|nr:DUF4912 domain-containing protein [Prochlorococcus marinus]